MDFTPFVAIAGAANGAVTADDTQLCIDGLKHGEHYAFVLRQGLPSAVGETLLRTADYDIYVRDRSPQARFTGRNYVLPRTGQAGIPIASVNAPKLDIDVLRIGDRSLLPTLRSEDFLSQLSGATARTIADEKGFRVWTGTLDTAPAALNADVVTAFPVLQAVGKLEPGLYIMTARPAGSPSDDEYGGRATQWFVVSDIGLAAFSGPDGVHVMARALSSAAPMANVEMRLVAKNNEVLATRTTDRDGFAAFDPGLSRGDGGLAPGLVVARVGDDYGFLDLAAQAFDLADRGVKGRPRAADRKPCSLPSAAFIVPVKRFISPHCCAMHAAQRCRACPLRLSSSGRTASNTSACRWRTRATVVVHCRSRCCRPRRTAPGACRPTSTRRASRSAGILPRRRLRAGAPRRDARRQDANARPRRTGVDRRFRTLSLRRTGADLDVAGNVAVGLASQPAVKGLADFTIGLDDEQVEASSAELEEHARTDAEGRATLSVPVATIATTRPTEATIALQVAEDGGRAVSRTITLPILPQGPVLALRQTNSTGDAAGGKAEFDVAAAMPDGRRLAKAGVGWTLFKISHHYQWYLQNGRWAFEPVKAAQRIAEGTLDLAANSYGHIARQMDYGAYRLEVRADGLQTSSLGFTIGWAGDETADVPDSARPDARQGGLHNGRRAARAPRAAVRRQGDGGDRERQGRRAADARSAGRWNTVDIPVKADWGSGAYLVATAYRPLDTQAKRLPGRAMGVAWFAIDRAARTLDVKLDAPATMRPARPAHRAGASRWAAAGRERACDARRRRCRHLEPHPLRACPTPMPFSSGRRRCRRPSVISMGI